MVKLFGPAASLDASGSLAESITYSKWKGRNYLRTKKTPKDPRSALQVGTRACFAFCASNWQDMSSGAKANWDDLALQNSITPFNAYLAHNTQRWRRFKFPTQDPETAEVGAIAAYAVGKPDTTRLRDAVDIDWSLTTPINQTWGVAFFRGIWGFDCARANCIAMLLSHTAMHTYHWIDENLIEGTIIYNSILFTMDGNDGGPMGQFWSVPT